MVHFWLAFAVLIALTGRNRTKYCIHASFFVLFMFAALRYMYGNDYRSYMAEYEYIKIAGISQFHDKLFVLLNKGSPSFYILIAITSAIFVYAVFLLVSKNLPLRYGWVGIFILVVNPYIYLMNLSAIRQCMAMVCFMAAVQFAIRRKILPYIGLIVIGALFHKSVLLMLPVYFIATQKPFRKRYICIIVFIMIVLLSVVDLVPVVQWLAAAVGESGYLHHVSGGLGNSLRATILTGIMFVYVLFNLHHLEGKYLVFAKLHLVGLVLGILAFNMAMLTRIQMYFDIFSIISIPAILIASRERGPVYRDFENPWKPFWKLVNKYVLPILVFVIYGLRYISFFRNPMWEAFHVYQTIFSAPWGVF